MNRWCINLEWDSGTGEPIETLAELQASSRKLTSPIPVLTLLDEDASIDLIAGLIHRVETSWIVTSLSMDYSRTRKR